MDAPSLLQVPPSHRKLRINDTRESLRYDYYSESCPQAEQIIRSTVQEFYEFRPEIAPALLRLMFHDCFVQGCDASVLLDPTAATDSEKQAPPNESLKGFDMIDIIKLQVEEACPGVVSCSDIVVLAARESVLVTGGPFYHLFTGRKDSKHASFMKANEDLPSPQDSLNRALGLFDKQGFNEKETVSLLGAHSTRTVHCNFFNNRLFNFNGSDRPDPSINTGFLGVLRSKCSSSHTSSSSPSSSPYASPSSYASRSSSSSYASPSPSPSSSPSSQNPGMKMDYEGPRVDFGTLYYRSLLQHKGSLFVDQQLTSEDRTKAWVQAYASDLPLFKRDFGLAMMKLSSLHNASIGGQFYPMFTGTKDSLYSRFKGTVRPQGAITTTSSSPLAAACRMDVGGGGANVAVGGANVAAGGGGANVGGGADGGVGGHGGDGGAGGDGGDRGRGPHHLIPSHYVDYYSLIEEEVKKNKKLWKFVRYEDEPVDLSAVGAEFVAQGYEIDQEQVKCQEMIRGDRKVIAENNENREELIIDTLVEEFKERCAVQQQDLLAMSHDEIQVELYLILEQVVNAWLARIRGD